ncbi:MAG: hypothetical protein JWP01_2926 [Myxococcales bacterium]|nr:hypothetical protein [Myxococcales bacterium]
MLRTLATFISLTLFAPMALADAPTPPAEPADAAPAKPADAPADAPKPDAQKTDAAKSDGAEAPAANAPAADAPVRSVSAASVTSPRPRLPNGLIAITVAELPELCRDSGKRALNPNLVQALPARISLANCVSDAKINALQLIDGNESIVAIEEAIAPSIELLDDVAAQSDAASKVMALHAKAQLYSNATSRMLKTVPATNQSTQESQALRDARRAILEAMMAPWREKQLEAHQAVVDVAKLNPQLAKNPVAQAAIADSRQRVAQAGSVATR